MSLGKFWFSKVFVFVMFSCSASAWASGPQNIVCGALEGEPAQGFLMGINYPILNGQLSTANAYYLAKLQWQDESQIMEQEVDFLASDCQFTQQSPFEFECKRAAKDAEISLSGVLDSVQGKVTLRLLARRTSTGESFLDRSVGFAAQNCKAF